MPELLGTKLRALYQRKKGRHLFDLDLSLDHAEFDGDLLLEAFEEYMASAARRSRGRSSRRTWRPRSPTLRS